MTGAGGNSISALRTKWTALRAPNLCNRLLR